MNKTSYYIACGAVLFVLLFASSLLLVTIFDEPGTFLMIFGVLVDYGIFKAIQPWLKKKTLKGEKSK